MRNLLIPLAFAAGIVFHREYRKWKWKRWIDSERLKLLERIAAEDASERYQDYSFRDRYPRVGLSA